MKNLVLLQISSLRHFTHLQALIPVRYQEKTLISVPFGTVWSLWSRSQKIMALVRRDFLQFISRITKYFFHPNSRLQGQPYWSDLPRSCHRKLYPLIFLKFFGKFIHVTRADNVKTWSKWRIIFLEINAKLKFLT